MKGLREDIGYMYDEAEQLVKKQVDLTRMEIIEKTAFIGGKIIATIVLLFVSLLVFFLLGVIMIVLLERVTGSYLEATLIVTSFYIIVALLIALFKKELIIKPFMAAQFRSFMEEVDKEKINELYHEPNN